MPGQKRKRLTPGLSGFTKVGPSDGLTPVGADPLSLSSFAGTVGAGFSSCETPTMAPCPAPHASHVAPKLYRFSPRLSASSGLFNSPMFGVQTPVFEYQSAPNVFHNSMLPPPFNGAGGPGPNPLGGAVPTPHPSAGLLSPIPFMDSPAAMHTHHELHAPYSMENPPRLSLAGTQPQNSVLERFRKFFDNQHGAVDFGSPSVTGAVQPQHQQQLGCPFGDVAFSLGAAILQHKDAAPAPSPPVPSPPGDDDDLSSGESHELLSPSANPELAESLLRSGSSCHQCKSRRMQGYLSFCSGAKAKRKSCRKKYCDACLAKFYQMQPSRSRSARDQTTWSCPSCRGICCCAACRRSKVAQAAAGRTPLPHPFTRTPELYSPATSMAVGLVYFGDFDLLEGSVPMQLPPPALAPPPRPTESLAFAPHQ